MIVNEKHILKTFQIIVLCFISSCCKCNPPPFGPSLSPPAYFDNDNNYQYYNPYNFHNGNNSHYDYDSSYHQYIPPKQDNDPFNYPVAR